VGNLESVTYPNGVAHSYSYDARNRLTNLAVSGTVAGAPGAIASYAYTLDASGHRLSVAELSGRAVSYGYDNLYRLTSETITSDPNSVNGTVSYGYDPVGNRLQKTSTLPGMPGTTSSYNANDQLASDTYDNDGNTTASNGKGYAYDFENHLVQQAGITVVYDGDGNRVAKTTANGTTQFLVDDLNPTGYAQVMDEVQSSAAVRTYTWGLELISEHQSVNSTPTTSYYVFDGHGSVRALTNAAGAVSDTYDYDAFGNLIHSTGTTPNNYLYSGEQFDPDLGLYYNRARYLNSSTGRFWTSDVFEGTVSDPGSQHKYLYSYASPVDYADPSGKSGNSIFNIFGNTIQKKIFKDYEDWARLNGHVGFTNKSIKTILRLPPAPRGDDIYRRPDIADVTDTMIYEIKPKIDAAGAYAQIADYIALILEESGQIWVPGTSFSDPQTIPLFGGLYEAIVEPTSNGAILYTVESKSPLGVPIVPIPITPDTISEEAIKEEERVAVAAGEAEIEEVSATAPLVSGI